MSSIPHTRPAPLAPTRPAPVAAKMPKFGWLEWCLISPVVAQAILLIPGVSAIRFATRVASYLFPLLCWAMAAQSGRKIAGGKTYSPASVLSFCAIWLLLSIVHPNVNTYNSALAELALTVAIFSPVYWAGAAIVDTRQLRRLVMILLVCNGASAAVGMMQIYRPDMFPLPTQYSNMDKGMLDSLMVKTDDGRSFLRPTGLTDTAGGAGLAGSVACLTGLAAAVTMKNFFAKIISMGISGIGLAIIFYSQVRSQLIVMVLGILIWIGLMALRRDFKRLTKLATFVAIIGVLGVGWVIRSGGSGVMSRFASLLENRVDQTYYSNRGRFLESTVYVLLENPLGLGPGRHGMMNAYFGDPFAPPDSAPMYSEIQISGWVLDGGAPLLFAYSAAIVMAMGIAMKMAIKNPDAELSFWAGAVACQGLFSVFACFGSNPFLSPSGLQFWLLLAALHGTDARFRYNNRARLAGSRS